MSCQSIKILTFRSSRLSRSVSISLQPVSSTRTSSSLRKELNKSHRGDLNRAFLRFCPPRCCFLVFISDLIRKLCSCPLATDPSTRQEDIANGNEGKFRRGWIVQFARRGLESACIGEQVRRRCRSSLRRARGGSFADFRQSTKSVRPLHAPYCPPHAFTTLSLSYAHSRRPQHRNSMNAAPQLSESRIRD